MLFKRHDPYPLKLATVSLAIDMNRNLPAMILLVLWSTLGTGCGSGPAMILESDIPAPPEMESRHSSNIDQRSGTLDGGKFTFRGPIEDVVHFTNNKVTRISALLAISGCNHSSNTLLCRAVQAVLNRELARASRCESWDIRTSVSHNAISI